MSSAGELLTRSGPRRTPPIAMQQCDAMKAENWYPGGRSSSAPWGSNGTIEGRERSEVAIFAMQVRLKEPTDQAWVESILRRCWGGSDIVVRGCVYKAADLPALIAGNREGLCTFAIESDGMSAELVTINALVPAKGIGTALIGALISRLAANGVRSLRVTTTNDNVNALGFYQRRGFRIIAVLPGAVDQARKIKPSIPLIGYRGIEVHDALVLALTIP